MKTHIYSIGIYREKRDQEMECQVRSVSQYGSQIRQPSPPSHRQALAMVDLQ